MKLTNSRCQCPECGEFFNSVYAFDRHRRWDASHTFRECLSPREMLDIGMVRNASGFWLGAKQIQSEQAKFHRKDIGKPLVQPAESSSAEHTSSAIRTEQDAAPWTQSEISHALPHVSSAPAEATKRLNSHRVHGKPRDLTEHLDAQHGAARNSKQSQYRASTISTPKAP